MSRVITWPFLGLAAGLAASGALFLSASAQQAAPTESVGVSARPIGALELGPEIPGMEGRQLRMRVLTLAPGGVFAVHGHVDRPAVEFVLSGTVTEYRGSAERVVHEGEPVLSDKGTTHWWRNTGTVPVVFVVADIFHPQ